MSIAVIDEELPYPATSGKRIRTLNLLTRVAQRHRISLICYRNADPVEVRQGTEYFRDHGMEVVLVDRPPPKKSTLRKDPGFYLALAKNLFSPLPYLVTANDSRELRKAVQEFNATHEVDLWQCEWTPYIEAVRGLKDANVVVMAHNVESLIWQRYYENERHPLKRWYIGHQWRKMQKFELDAFREAARVVTVSPQDAQLVRDQFGRSHVDVVDNGVDTAYFQSSETPRDPATILFLGSLDWRPNLDAISLLIKEVFPAVQAAEPEARLSLVGRNPPPWLVQLSARNPNIELHADVPDVRPFLARCSAMAVPLRIGGGSRLKILEALSTATPVVSTQIGAEGLQLVAGEHYVEADIPQMAEALIAALREPARMRTMAKRGQEVVLEHYDWAAIALRLEAVWQSTLSCAPGN